MSNFEGILNDKTYPKLISASAGTGKTEIIARAVEHLVINDGVDISSIAAITFTNKAADEMKERFRHKLYAAWTNGNSELRQQIDKSNTAKWCTFHKFCEPIVREFAYEIGFSPDFTISNISFVKDRVANQVINQNFNEEILGVLPSFEIAKILRGLEETSSDKGIQIILTPCKEVIFWGKLRNYIAKVYPVYTKMLEDEKVKSDKITVNDLIRYAVKILEIKKLKSHISNWLKYLFVDEAQDINHEQRRLIELLIEQGVKVFIVGDGKQSIYAFRGSDLAAFVSLADKVSDLGGKTYTLKINYRSNKYMVEKVNNLFSRDFNYHKDETNNLNLNFGYHLLEAREDADEGERSIEMAYGEKLKSLISKHHTEGTTTAILCRTNREASDAFAELREAGIQADLFVSKSLYKTKVIIDFCKMLNYIIGGGELEKHELFYTDFYLAAHTFNVGEPELFKEIDKASVILKMDGITDTIAYLATNLQLEAYYENLQDAQALANILKLQEITRNLQTDGMTSMEIVRYLNIMIATKQDETQPRTNNDTGIVVSTIHMFKGLDADTIIAYGLDSNLTKTHFADFYYRDGQLFFNKDELLPHTNENSHNYDIPHDELFVKNKTNIEIANLEEEVRVLYVMTTRAKKKLILHSKKSLQQFEKTIKTTPNHVSYLRWLLNK